MCLRVPRPAPSQVAFMPAQGVAASALAGLVLLTGPSCQCSAQARAQPRRRVHGRSAEAGEGQRSGAAGQDAEASDCVPAAAGVGLQERWPRGHEPAPEEEAKDEINGCSHRLLTRNPDSRLLIAERRGLYEPSFVANSYHLAWTTHMHSPRWPSRSRCRVSVVTRTCTELLASPPHAW